jgi:hypothetical protein
MEGNGHTPVLFFFLSPSSLSLQALADLAVGAASHFPKQAGRRQGLR